ncbi:MAG: ParB/RepB/Spo0J family partition protein [Bacilli bacterium]|nr:ParB/RepB/Spo0J family partition protein [Bacilli bacterium]
MESRRALGKGLEQLFDLDNLNVENVSDFERNMYKDVTNEEIIELNVEELRPNPYQPRTVFDEDALNELAESIKENGVIEPIIVKKSIKGYDVIAGERRLKASKIAGNKTIPAIIRQLSDDKMAEIALLENLQRENLTALEEARAYKSLQEKLNLTQEQLAKKVSKSRSHITNMLGLLRLPNEVQDMIQEKKLTMGHARVLSKLEDRDEIIKMANQIANEKLSVRNVEEKSSEKKKKVETKKKRNEYEYVQDLLREKLDTKVKIKDKKIEITFVSVQDLNRILEIMNIKE